METALENSISENIIAVEEKKLQSDADEKDVLLEIKKDGEGMHVEQDTENSSNPVSSSTENDRASIKQVPLVSITDISFTGTNDSSSIQKNIHKDELRSTKAKMSEVREENERLKKLLSKIVEDYRSLQMHFFEILKQEDAKNSPKTARAHQERKELELVSLSLGRSSTEDKTFGKKSSNLNGGLSLGLECKFDPDSSVTIKNNSSSENSFEDQKEEEQTETWPPSKILKTERNGDDKMLQKTKMKNARVSVRARCDAPTINDGCHWRKYGQKIAKGHPCPRSYYRCTISPTCPVKKQVQRCAKDMSVLITTYEGTHNHPLPPSATAIASTTSAAASMLQSRSLISQPGLGSSVSAPASSSTLNGLNFSLSKNEIPQKFYFPDSSISTSKNSQPTITLDLSAPTTTASHFSGFSSAPRNYSPKCLDFSSSSSSTALETIAAATKMIATNPTFRSALAAAITSFVGNGGGGVRDNAGMGEQFGLDLKLGELLTSNTLYPNSNNGIGCSSSNDFNKSPASSPVQQDCLVLFPPSLPFSTSKTALGSPANCKD